MTDPRQPDPREPVRPPSGPTEDAASIATPPRRSGDRPAAPRPHQEAPNPGGPAYGTPPNVGQPAHTESPRPAAPRPGERSWAPQPSSPAQPAGPRYVPQAPGPRIDAPQHDTEEVWVNQGTGRDFATPSTAPKSKRPPIWVIALIAGLVFALLGGGLFWMLGQRSGPQVADPNDPDARTGSQPVLAYLNALAAGDIDTALSLGPRGPGADTLLNTEALQESLTRTPLRDITVYEPDPAAPNLVNAAYTLGGQQVRTSFGVHRENDGSWVLDRSTVTLTITATRTDGVPLLINGIEVTENTLEVVPGSYAIATGLPFLDYDPAGDVLATSLDAYPSLTILEPRLTEEGTEALQARAMESLDECLTRRSVDPEGCPQSVDPGSAVVPDSARWTSARDPWPQAQQRLSAEDKGTAEMSVPLDLRLTVTFASGGTTTDAPVQIAAMLNADMRVASEDAIDIVWQ
ncbi:hypothetical protein [Parenemella sanctibonifatiensis]|uniref:DUF4878 domain-containing protein n=1 Tax=Parenemella sanctibonifatiensis TaxID=2016505 RepID=A0A255E7F8_9ACTN|nr:hypothetical protein [Parenemella sanctibonifatiensis]OYN87508.1 hypothetical protein CGZ92_07280 [Parenemella sanctibonifatiensis]